METGNDVLNFLSKMEVYSIQTGSECDNSNIMRKVLIDDFKHIDIDKLVEILRSLDNLYLEYLREKLYLKSLIRTLRKNL